MLKILLHSCVVLVCSFSTLACNATNPSHRPSIGGAIMLVDNKDKGLCFLPKFETAYLTATKKYEDLKFINLTYVDVTRGNDPLSDKVVWKASPNSNKFYKLKEGESICMNHYTTKLNEVKHENLTNGQYTVVIGGMDDKQKYNLRFIERFEYPIK